MKMNAPVQALTRDADAATSADAPPRKLRVLIVEDSPDDALLIMRELCREGYPLLADEAADTWYHGNIFQIDDETRISRTVAALIDQCNWLIAHTAEAA